VSLERKIKLFFVFLIGLALTLMLVPPVLAGDCDHPVHVPQGCGDPGVLRVLPVLRGPRGLPARCQPNGSRKRARI
jgi:hypothetical protein